jgi:hypothetical protein
MSGHQGEPAAPSDAESLCRALIVAATSCPHTIDANDVHLMHDAKQPGHNALRQLADRLMAVCAANFPAVPSPEGWRPVETAPAGEWVLVEIDGKAVTEGVFAKEFGGWDWRATDDEADDAVVTGWMPKPVARNAHREG